MAELHEAVGGLLEHAFGSTVWVAGELRDLSRSAQGHSYFDLVDPDRAGEHGAAKLSITLFNGHRQRINSVIKRHGGGVRIEDGTVLRISGELKTYAAQSRLQLIMTGIDPSYTEGVAQKRRERALAALAADGLLDRNAGVPLPHPPLHLALITSRGSAAHADVVHELERGGIGFSVRSIDARTQGAQAEDTLIAALLEAEAMGVDAVLLVRGGGAKADLDAFDGEALGRAIAGLAVPVLTGIGHETDRSVADEVAHSAYKTPTAAAAAVVDIALQARRDLDDAAASVATAARGRLLRAAAGLDQVTRTTAIACRGHVVREAQVVDDRMNRVIAAAPRLLDRASTRLDAAGVDLSAAAERSIADAERNLTHAAALVAAHDPARVLAAGWSITRTADGSLVRSAHDANEGEILVTSLADGSISSSVTSTSSLASTEPTTDREPGTPR